MRQNRRQIFLRYFCTHKVDRWVVIAAKKQRTISKNDMCKVRPFNGPFADAFWILSSLECWSTIRWLCSTKTRLLFVRHNSQLVVEQPRGSVVQWAFLLCSPADGLEVSVLDFCLGLWGGGLCGRSGGGGLACRLVLERAVFGGRKAELLGHVLVSLRLLVEAQFPQQLVDLGAGHVGQGDPLWTTHVLNKDSGKTVLLDNQYNSISHDWLFTVFNKRCNNVPGKHLAFLYRW